MITIQSGLSYSWMKSATFRCSAVCHLSEGISKWSVSKRKPSANISLKLSTWIRGRTSERGEVEINRHLSTNLGFFTLYVVIQPSEEETCDSCITRFPMTIMPVYGLVKGDPSFFVLLFPFLLCRPGGSFGMKVKVNLGRHDLYQSAIERKA